MRLGGFFPFGLPPIPIALATGQFFFPPAGQYIATTGPNTVLEWFDQQQEAWRLLVPSSNAGMISCDGCNFRLRNTTGALNSLSITAAGSGATNGIGQTATGVTAAVSAPGANGRTSTIFPIVGGQLTATMTLAATPGAPGTFTAGSGLLVPPLIVVSPPPQGGIPATMTCTISGGAVNTVTVTNQGGGYMAPPLIAVYPQVAGYAGLILPPPAVQNLLGGSNLPAGNYIWPPFMIPNTGVFTTLPLMTAPAITGSGTLTGVQLIDNGANYSGTPTVTVTGAGAATVTTPAVVAAASDVSYLQPSVDE